MEILKDKILFGCLLVALASISFFLYRKIPLDTTETNSVSSLKEKANQIHEATIRNQLQESPVTEPKTVESQRLSKPDEIAQIAQMESDIKAMIEADEEARSTAIPPEPQVKVTTLSPIPAPSSAPATVAKKSRPRLGTNEWLVGLGAGADSTDLEPVLKNTVDGDIVTLSPGTYEFSLAMVGSNVEILGQEGVMLKFKKSYSNVQISSILLKNIKLEFEAEDNHISINSPRLSITFDNVSINENDQTITLNKGTKATFKNSHFSGTSFVFFDLTEGVFENCYFEKGKSFLTLYGSSKVKVNNSQLMNFSSNAISAQSYLVKFEAENLKVSNGTSAFFGKFTNENTFVRESEFKSLSYFTLQPETKINCSICQKTNIKN